jgi:hypothetical protein
MDQWMIDIVKVLETQISCNVQRPLHQNDGRQSKQG